ncbi:iron-responsive element-binding protein 2 isoform X1 [Scyliorhinus canicula]|uniref:iron-responsive element-binding protein 2 isoform X1 n=2 Tax=Scyliorhinus canicula TaxID=7830 RepID=UPI0018F6A4E7|nr:iron-responsive element-binding protein 2 isoform X1 [Scyliorhinus canicula]
MAAETIAEHPFHYLIEPLTADCPDKKYFNILKLNGPRYVGLPYSIRVLLEAAVRNCDGLHIKKEDALTILDWKNQQNQADVPFWPARVLLQDFTGIPAVVDFAAMREAVKKLGGDPSKVNPVCPTDLIVDHSLQFDYSKSAIQNAPNPGGGDCSGASPRMSNANLPPKASPCRRPSGCLSQCSSETGSTPSGKRSTEIENTPLLCPFHLQPVAGPETLLKNQEIEFNRNKERLQFFKWASKVFQNVTVVPPGTGIVHQVNLEYLSRVVFDLRDVLFPDSVVGTDSHTTMVNGLGILGWGVGGIESEAVMLGQPVTLTLPEVVGCKLVGSTSTLATSIDVVLSITKHLRQVGVSGKFVEFFGPGVSQLSVADRTTIANMCPEYGATVSFFPVDDVTLQHLRQTGYGEAKIEAVETYLKAVKLFRNYQNPSEDPEYSQVIELNLSAIVPYVSGPKRPQDRVVVNDMKKDFQNSLNEKVGFKGFQILPARQKEIVAIEFEGKDYKLAHGSVVIAAVISCTNNCNPSVMLAAGLLAKKATEAGLSVKPYIKTSLSPGSGMVTYYLNASGVLPYLHRLGYEVIGYGCATCVGNTAPLPESVVAGIQKGDLVACGVLSGNKNFEGRLCDCVRANYLASPPLVVAYAIAGTVNIDFEKEPLGVNSKGREIYLRDIWPSREEIQQVEEQQVIPSMFKELREKVEKGNNRWNDLEAPESLLYPWDSKSTYIRCPSFFDKFTKELSCLQSIENAHVLLHLGDSVTTDHISPAGSIARNSAAARYLTCKGLTPREFNSYGARRGNDAVMTRGTFASIRLLNKFIGKTAPKTIHIPSGQTLDVFDAAERYQREGFPLIILAGKRYGLGSSRDWAAKGPYLLGVKAVLAESYEKMHKNHLVGMGIIPLQFLPEENVDKLGLTGKERYTITIPKELCPGTTVNVTTNTGKTFKVVAKFDNEMEITFYKQGGILNYVARKML